MNKSPRPRTNADARRRHGPTGLYQNASGKWCIDVSAKGQRIRRVVGDSKREAEEILAAVRADMLREKYGLKRRLKNRFFEELGKEFLETYSKPNKRSWQRDEISLNSLNKLFGKVVLANMNPAMIEKYKAKRLESGVTGSSINRELALLKIMFRKAIEWKMADENPAASVKLLRENKRRERILTEDEIIRLEAEATSHLRPIIRIALNTGMRRGELLALRWKHINFGHSHILIEDS